jgi:hypothetical protein
MNERIRQLALQAVEETQLLMIMEYRNFESTLYEKFAQLIVRECIDIAQDRAAFDGFPPNDVNHIISEIKEHFGVEQ